LAEDLRRGHALGLPTFSGSNSVAKSTNLFARISASNPITHKKLNRRRFMLGEKIGEISGKITVQRVLPNLGGDPKIESSFQAAGSVLGTNIKDVMIWP
jgi:hypothetical protein